MRPRIASERIDEVNCNMKKLSAFLKFEFERFAVGKKFVVIGQQEWKDFHSGDVLGTKLEVVIAQDKTEYPLKAGEVVSNQYEKFTVKIPKKINAPMNVEVRIKGATATVYGDYRNMLSVVAEDIEIVRKEIN